ncbi:putative metalloprotease CJM1_0395 family protein [Caminibacter sp.]
MITTQNTPHTSNSNDLLKNPKIKEEITKLQAIDNKVRAHELAHKAAGGSLAGAPSYGYVTGPDGKKYAISGEVPIKLHKGKTPEETIKIAEQVKAAALAPADPSPQDLKVAQNAEMMAAKARQEENMQKLDIYA